MELPEELKGFVLPEKVYYAPVKNHRGIAHAFENLDHAQEYSGLKGGNIVFGTKPWEWLQGLGFAYPADPGFKLALHIDDEYGSFILSNRKEIIELDIKTPEKMAKLQENAKR